MEKNKKLNIFSRLIQESLKIRDIDERLLLADSFIGIINPDYIEILKIKDSASNTISRKVLRDSFLPVSFDDLIKSVSADSLKKNKIQFIRIDAGNSPIYCSLITQFSHNSPHGYILFEKDVPFSSYENEMLALYANFLDVINERASVEDELKRKNEAFKSEINKIRKMQVSMMPQFKKISDFDIASTYMPAQDLSGDFIDAFFVDDDTYQIIICDVSGHGIAASYLGNEFRTLFRVTSRQGRSPADIARFVNDITSRELNDLYYFCSLIICQIKISDGSIRYLNAGHPDPILYRKDKGLCETLTQTGPIIGIMVNEEFSDIEVNLNDGDFLFLYTDGITEASHAKSKNPEEQFGIERLKSVIERGKDYSSTDILHFVISSVYEFTNFHEQSDDTSAICIKKGEVITKNPVS